MSDVLQFRVPGNPIPKERPRVGATRTRTPQRTLDHEAVIAGHAAIAWRKVPNPTQIFGVECAFVREDHIHVDIDNLCKTVLDGINGVVWKDDSQVHELMAKLHFTSQPGALGYTVVRIWEVE